MRFNGARPSTPNDNTRLTDPEILEWRHPVLLEDFNIREHSGGKGHTQAVTALSGDFGFLDEMTAAVVSSTRETAPFGLLGMGQPGKNYVELANGSVTALKGRPNGYGPGDVLSLKHQVVAGLADDTQLRSANRGAQGARPNTCAAGSCKPHQTNAAVTRHAPTEAEPAVEAPKMAPVGTPPRIIIPHKPVPAAFHHESHLYEDLAAYARRRHGKSHSRDSCHSNEEVWAEGKYDLDDNIENKKSED